MRGKESIYSLLKRRVIIKDGGMGTLGVAPRSANLLYLEAGADIIQANTFLANSYQEVLRLVHDTVTLRDEFDSSCGSCHYVAVPIGPVGNYYQRVEGGIDGGGDIILLETIYDSSIGVEALKECASVLNHKGVEIPVIVSVTIDNSTGTIRSGETIDSLYHIFTSLSPLFAFGVNCSKGVDGLSPHIERLSKVSSIPIYIAPSGGLPNEKGEYPETPASFSAKMAILAQIDGVRIVGGCCGTTPSHIRALKGALGGI